MVAGRTAYRLAAGTSLEDSAASVRLVRGGVAATIESPPEGVRSLIGRLASGGVDASALDRTSAEVGYVLAALERRGLLAASVPGLVDVEPLRRGIAVTGAAAPRSPRLSRFAVLHSQDGALALESPLANGRAVLHGRRGAALAGALAAGEAARDDGERAAVALLAAAGLLAGGREETGAARAWELHDLLFHAETRGWSDGRPRGSTYRLRGVLEPPPDARPWHSGAQIELERAATGAETPFAEVVERRRAERTFDDERPVTASELGRLLDGAAARRAVFDDGGIEVSRRPAPSGGAIAALEIYPIVRLCAGLEPALYHYEADVHRLRRLGAPPDGFPGGAAQVALAVSLRHARVAWKYERIAYGLALLNLGVLYQTIWLAATALGLGGFPLGSIDGDRFAHAAGLDPLEETGLGAFLLGRPLRDAHHDAG